MAKWKNSAVKQMRKRQLAKEHGYKCFYCKTKFAYSVLIIEHIVPFSRGGTNDMNNTILACDSCNSSKHNQLIEEWFERNDFRVASLYREYRYRKTISNTLRKMIDSGKSAT